MNDNSSQLTFLVNVFVTLLLIVISFWALVGIYHSFEPKSHSVTNESVTVLDFELGFLINNCESQEHWGEPGYEYDWRIHFYDGELSGFYCTEPKEK